MKIDQSQLTEECWNVQVFGTEICDTCTFQNTDDCSGINIRETGVNSKGYPVPDEFITLHYEVSRPKSKLSIKDGEWNDDNWVDNDLME